MRNIFLLMSVLFSFCVSAQNEVFINSSQSYSWFKYQDSNNLDDDEMESNIKQGFGLGYTINLPSDVVIRSEIGFANLGARSSFNDKLLEWNLNYINFNFTGGYCLKLPVFQPYVLAGLQLGYMYKANQIIGDEYYNLKKTDKFNSLDYGVNLVYGLNGQFSKNIGLFFEMRNTFGLAQIENKLEENKQDLYNRVFSVHLGIKFILNKDSEKKTKPVNEDML